MHAVGQSSGLGACRSVYVVGPSQSRGYMTVICALCNAAMQFAAVLGRKLAPMGAKRDITTYPWVDFHPCPPQLAGLAEILPRQAVFLHFFVERLTRDPQRLIGRLQIAAMCGNGPGNQCFFMRGHLLGKA